MSSTSSSLKKIVQAGAGAGKTTDLVSLFLQETEAYYSANKQWPKIVVTTFTRKATQELKERIQHKILETQLKLKRDLEFAPSDEIFQERLLFFEEMFDYVNKKSLVQISTIHGILNLFLRASATQINLSSDYTFVSWEESFLAAQKILKKSFLQNPSFLDLLETYDFKTLTTIFLGLFENWMHLGSIKGARGRDLIQSEKRALDNELKNGISICQKILAEVSQPGWISFLQEIESSAQHFISQGAELDDLDFEGLLASLNVRKPGFTKAKEPFSSHLDLEFSEWRDPLKKRIKSFLDWTTVYSEYEEAIEKTESLSLQFCEQYLQHKLTTGQLTMSDLELITTYSLRQNPELGVAFSKNWNFWMIDEFQDTSPIQDSILESFIQSTKSYYVGDPQQSIYLFRGARSEVFFNKVQKIVSQGGSFSQKLINYRSYKEVLSFVNSVFTRIDSKMFSTMDLGKLGDNSTGELTTLWQVPVDGSTGMAVANRVVELMDKGCAADSIAVLLRTNKQVQEISEAFKKSEIPFQIHGSGLFYSRREIQDLLVIIKFVMNPKDDFNFLSLCRSPWVQINDQELVNFRASTKGFLFNQIQTSGNKGLVHLKKLLENSEKFGILQALKEFLTESGFIFSSLVYDPSGRREANIWKMLTLLENEFRRPGFSLLQFIIDSQLAASGELENEDGDAAPVISPNRVNIMTIHSSKGLQFDHVIVPFLDKKQRSSKSKDLMIEESTGIFTLKVPSPEGEAAIESPLSQKIKLEIRAREAKEELRTFYVACTRAIASLTLIVNAKREKDSIGELLPLSFVEGVQSIDQTQYRVRLDLPELRQLKREAKGQQQVRKKYQEDFKAEMQFAITRQKAFLFEPSVSGILKSVNGTQFHHLMESLKYSPVAEVLKMADPNTVVGMTYLLQQTAIPLLKIIQQGETEFGFSFVEDSRRFSGQIDLWGTVQNKTWIVDYKTGQSKYQKEAFEQLQFYHYGLIKTKEIKSDREVHLAVLYPQEQKIFIRSANYLDSKEFIESLIYKSP